MSRQHPGYCFHFGNWHLTITHVNHLNVISWDAPPVISCCLGLLLFQLRYLPSLNTSPNWRLPLHLGVQSEWIQLFIPAYRARISTPAGVPQTGPSFLQGLVAGLSKDLAKSDIVEHKPKAFNCILSISLRPLCKPLLVTWVCSKL